MKFAVLALFGLVSATQVEQRHTSLAQTMSQEKSKSFIFAQIANKAKVQALAKTKA